MFALGLSDVFYTSGRFPAVIDPAFVLVGLLGLIPTALALGRQSDLGWNGVGGCSRPMPC